MADDIVALIARLRTAADALAWHNVGVAPYTLYREAADALERLQDQRDKIHAAMGAYPDSDLVSLAETLNSHAREYERLNDALVEGAEITTTNNVRYVRAEKRDTLRRQLAEAQDVITVLKAGAPIIHCCKHCEICAEERDCEVATRGGEERHAEAPASRLRDKPDAPAATQGGDASNESPDRPKQPAIVIQGAVTEALVRRLEPLTRWLDEHPISKEMDAREIVSVQVTVGYLRELAALAARPAPEEEADE